MRTPNLYLLKSFLLLYFNIKTAAIVKWSNYGQRFRASSKHRKEWDLQGLKKTFSGQFYMKTHQYSKG
ncbi:hypothetical protein MBAV_002187 [Candidatus Magnetobacterium bavaricum]|uniref:Uncharacterized protein n=1 Tax=Candidatus Magnetobacterium bavaricum TaxID=29290 RepID=A0A0F3GUT0_9BACT|nr:hypothetical protein MBAV_002187 [Candidatus Magnetobacterium bavaricum]